MLFTSHRRRFAFLSILLLLFVSLGGGNGGVVLCILPGGHIELEGVLEGCCDSPAENNDALSSTGSGSPDCEACIDVPLSGMENCVVSGQGSGFSKGLPVVRAHVRALPVHPAAAAPFSGSDHHKTRHLASVRSVNLRI